MPLGVMRVFPEYLVVDSFWERDSVAVPFMAGLTGVVVLSFLVEMYVVSRFYNKTRERGDTGGKTRGSNRAPVCACNPQSTKAL